MRQKWVVFVLACTMAAAVPRRASAFQRSAQEPAPQIDADQTRQDLEDVLKQYPPTLPQVLKLDPTLLENTAYLQPYPALAGFLAKHPEVGHNPSYFFADFGNRGEVYSRPTANDRAAQIWYSFIEGFEVICVVVAVASGILVLLKMVIDYRRWSRLTKTQTEVHTKLLDRFGSNEDLLAYIQTPAGRRFLESSPVSVDSPRSIIAPYGRILWSAQAGAVLAVLGFGIAMIAHYAVDDVAGPIEAIGAIVIALGIGFLISAFIAYVLSRRFGLVQDPTPAEPRG